MISESVSYMVYISVMFYISFYSASKMWNVCDSELLL